MYTCSSQVARDPHWHIDLEEAKAAPTIEAKVSMVDLASSKCFTKLCKNILTLTEPRANAQLVVKGVVIPTVVFCQ